MCANYRPSSPETLKALPLPPPDFAYGEAYPGSVVPIVTNFAPRQWVAASFGLVPGWARALLQGFDAEGFVAVAAPR